MTDMCEVSVEAQFNQFVDAAITRLRYLYPDLNFSQVQSGIKFDGEFEGTEAKEVVREINHQLYREKIFADTLSIRRSLYSND